VLLFASFCIGSDACQNVSHAAAKTYPCGHFPSA
jgi:hypothetical protein